MWCVRLKLLREIQTREARFECINPRTENVTSPLMLKPALEARQDWGTSVYGDSRVCCLIKRNEKTVPVCNGLTVKQCGVLQDYGVSVYFFSWWEHCTLRSAVLNILPKLKMLLCSCFPGIGGSTYRGQEHRGERQSIDAVERSQSTDKMAVGVIRVIAISWRLVLLQGVRRLSEIVISNLVTLQRCFSYSFSFTHIKHKVLV